MAPLPKRRHSSRRQGKRRSAIKLTLKKLIKCANCGSFLLPHRACPSCGFYDNKKIIDIKIKNNKKTSSS